MCTQHYFHIVWAYFQHWKKISPQICCFWPLLLGSNTGNFANFGPYTSQIKSHLHGHIWLQSRKYPFLVSSNNPKQVLTIISFPKFFYAAWHQILLFAPAKSTQNGQKWSKTTQNPQKNYFWPKIFQIFLSYDPN